MKKSLLTRLGAGALILTLVSTVLLSGTLAKYTTNVSGTAKATVAKWSFKAGSTEGASTLAEYTFKDLEKTVGVVDGKIAPGTSGKIPVYIDLTDTEVATNLKIEAKVDDAAKLPAGLKIYKVIKDGKGGDAFTLTTNDQAVFDTNIDVADITAAKGDYSIYWEWSDDSSDTSIGEGANGSAATITVKVTGTQISPTKPIS